MTVDNLKSRRKRRGKKSDEVSKEESAALPFSHNDEFSSRTALNQKKNSITSDRVVNQKYTERLIAEALPEGIIVLEHDGNMKWWNNVAKSLLNLSQKKHKTINVKEVIHDTKFLSLFAKLDGKEIKIKSPINPDIYLSLSLCPYWGSQQLLIIHDITHTLKLESVREDFIANVSHELRTPLTVFRGHLELLQARDKIDNEKINKILEQMEHQCQRMESLVTDLLLLSRLESIQPNAQSRERVNIASLLKNIYNDARTLSGDQRHQFHLELDEEMTLQGVHSELHSAFSNLVFNAVRYTPPQGKIYITCYQDEFGRYITVKDSGIGIAADDIPRITQRFYRVDKSRMYKGKGGTGLGLAIVKHVLLRHGGELSIESELNKGSTFRCSFPLE